MSNGEDMVNHPRHYEARVPGIECIEVARHFDFCLGNVIKYVWRAGLKGDAYAELEDLRKARWYLNDCIAQRERAWRKKYGAEGDSPEGEDGYPPTTPRR